MRAFSSQVSREREREKERIDKDRNRDARRDVVVAGRRISARTNAGRVIKSINDAKEERRRLLEKNSSFLFSSADGKIKKKRTMERKSDRISTGASSASSFEPVIVDIGDGTNDNNDLSKGGGGRGGRGGGGGSWFGEVIKTERTTTTTTMITAIDSTDYSSFFSSLYFLDKP